MESREETVENGVEHVPFYALGHTERELERLKAQAHLVDPITRRFFHAAGITPGMRVLDVGCGVGDVSFLVADLVGETGTGRCSCATHGVLPGGRRNRDGG